jgi:hypothetical protein
VIESSDEDIDDIQCIADEAPNLRSLADIFQSSLSKQNGLTYIVLDGLDEFHDAPEVLHILGRLQHTFSRTKLRLLMSSRPIPPVYNNLRDADTETIDVMAHEADIDHYVLKRLSEPPFDRVFSSQDEVEKLQTLIRHNSNGM